MPLTADPSASLDVIQIATNAQIARYIHNFESEIITSGSVDRR